MTVLVQLCRSTETAATCFLTSCNELKSLQTQRIKHRLVDMTEWPDESTSIHHNGLCFVAYVPAVGLDYPPADGYHLLLDLLL